jgi:hypothetical protein
LLTRRARISMERGCKRDKSCRNSRGVCGGSTAAGAEQFPLSSLLSRRAICASPKQVDQSRNEEGQGDDQKSGAQNSCPNLKIGARVRGPVEQA